MKQLTREPVLLSGLDVMTSIRDGHLPRPPAASLLDLLIEEVEPGRTVFRFLPGPRFSNGTTVHGGVLAAVADFAVTTAVMTTLPADAALVTSNLNITYLAPVALDSPPLRCEGQVVRSGGTLAHAEATFLDPAGTVVLRATGTCRVHELGGAADGHAA